MKSIKILLKKNIDKIANIYFIFLLIMLLSNYWTNGFFIDLCSSMILFISFLFFINMSIKIKWLAFSLGFLGIIWSLVMVFAFHLEVRKSIGLPFFNTQLFIGGIPFMLSNVFFSIKIFAKCFADTAQHQPTFNISDMSN